MLESPSEQCAKCSSGMVDSTRSRAHTFHSTHRDALCSARTSSPCVVFFDELDALCPRRAGDSSSAASERGTLSSVGLIRALQLLSSKLLRAQWSTSSWPRWTVSIRVARCSWSRPPTALVRKRDAPRSSRLLVCWLWLARACDCDDRHHRSSHGAPRPSRQAALCPAAIQGWPRRHPANPVSSNASARVSRPAEDRMGHAVQSI